MAFVITVKNEGDDGTVEVTERVNDNENTQVFNAFMQHDDTADVACLGSSPKDFTWIHHASNMTGGPTSLSDGDILVVAS